MNALWCNSQTHLKASQNSKGMFVWSDFREDGKWRREKWKENDDFGCLVESEKEERFWWDPPVFSPPPPKHNLSKLERKWEWKLDKNIWTKLPTFFFYYYYFFFFGQPQPGVINVACLLFFFFPFFLLGFTVSLDVDFFFYKYDDVHHCMNPWFTIVPVPFFFLNVFSF